MNILRVVLFLVSVRLVRNDNDANDVSNITDDKRVLALMKDKKRYQRVRCSRRYTPGSCLDPVRPVWTFVAPLQSCTERLGCPSGLFANRFNSLEECTNMCRELVYLYMYLQSLDNDTFRVPDEETSTLHVSDVMYQEFRQDLDNEDEQDLAGEDVEDVEADKRQMSKRLMVRNTRWIARALPPPCASFRRNFKSILSNLPEPNPGYAEDRQYEASDDRPPTQSRRELMEDTMDELIVPDIDHFV